MVYDKNIFFKQPVSFSYNVIHSAQKRKAVEPGENFTEELSRFSFGIFCLSPKHSELYNN